MSMQTMPPSSVGAGFFYPINTFPDFQEVKSWFEPHMFESTRYGDNYYGLPCSGIAFTLICNKDIFDDEGIASSQNLVGVPQAAKRLTRDTDGDGNDRSMGTGASGRRPGRVLHTGSPRSCTRPG